MFRSYRQLENDYPELPPYEAERAPPPSYDQATSALVNQSDPEELAGNSGTQEVPNVSEHETAEEDVALLNPNEESNIELDDRLICNGTEINTDLSPVTMDERTLREFPPPYSVV